MMKSFLKKLFAVGSAGKAYKVPGTLEGTFEYRNGRITGELFDLHDLKESEISIHAMRHEQQVLSARAERVGKTNRYRFEMSINERFSPAEFVSEKVTVIARSTKGASGNLRLGGASGLELVRDYFGVPAESLLDIDFTRGGNSREYLGKGWSGPETEFTWTEDEDSFLNMPAINKPGQYAIRIVAGAQVPKPFVPSQFVEMFLNDELLWTQYYTESFHQFAEIRFRGDQFFGQPLELRIHHPDAARPSDINRTSQDSRRLALAVKRLTLVRFLDPAA